MSRVIAAFVAGLLVGTLVTLALHRAAPAPAPPSTQFGWNAVPGGRVYRVPGEGICFVPDPK